MVLQSYEFRGLPVRVCGEPERPLFVAADVCAAIGILNSRDALAKGVAVLRGPGLYRLIFRSNKPNAEAFQRWVFHSVLPDVRRTGAYLRTAEDARLTPAVEALLAVVERLEEEAQSLFKPKTTKKAGKRQTAPRNPDGRFRRVYNQTDFLAAMGKADGNRTGEKLRQCREVLGMSRSTFFRMHCMNP